MIILIWVDDLVIAASDERALNKRDAHSEIPDERSRQTEEFSWYHF